jgi:regulatory protein
MTTNTTPDAQGAADEVPDADPESVARTIVLSRLARSPQTRAQLEEVLRRRRVPDEVTQAVLDRMTEVGLVDDAAYAQEYVRIRRETRGLSARALAQELSRRGVSVPDVQEALAELDAEADRAAAKALVEKKWSSVARLDQDAARRRLVGMLGRRGYGPGLAFGVVREVESERGVAGSAADDFTASGLVADGLG